MFAAIPEATVLALYQLLLSHARIWTAFFAMVLPRDLTIVALAFTLTPTMGATGLAIAYAVGWGVALVLIAIMALRTWPKALAAAAAEGDGL
jgi:hypothetical protein